MDERPCEVCGAPQGRDDGFQVRPIKPEQLAALSGVRLCKEHFDSDEGRALMLAAYREWAELREQLRQQ
jgi:hypothetical protein